MKFKSTTLLLASALILGTSLSSMAQSESPVTKIPAAGEKAMEASHIMAIIDGQKITAGELDAMANDIDPAIARMPEQQRRITVLKIYIDMKTMADAAVEQKLDKSEDFVKRMAIMRDNTLQQIYFKDNILDKITDADIQARYEKEIASMPQEQEVHARHILVKTKKEAEALIKRLENGEKFETLAKEASTDGSAAMGGDLGYFSRGQMVKPFEDAAFALKSGEYTKEPVESPFGWHIIMVEDSRNKLPPSIEDTKDSLTNMIARDRYTDIITKLREKANITYPDKDVAALMQTSDEDDALPGEAPNEEE